LAPDDPDTASTSSYIFAQAENNTRQGVPVPVGYGRFKVGSTVISVNLLSIDKAIASGQGFYDKLFNNITQESPSEDSIDITSSALARSI